MSELDANPMQILLYQSATSAVILLFFIPAFDSVSLLIDFPYDSNNMVNSKHF
jgi:hypothetical protein